MKIQEILTSSKRLFSKRMDRTLSSMSDLFNSGDPDSRTDVPKEVIMLLGAVIWADGKLADEELSEFRKYLAAYCNTEHEIEGYIKTLKARKKTDIKKCAEALLELPQADRLSIINALLEMAFANDAYAPEQKNLITEISGHLGISQDLLQEVETKFIADWERRQRIVRSGAGIAVALVIISIFILTATFLKSVLFGLILAYFFLPLEKWFEKVFFTNPIVVAIHNLVNLVWSPFIKISKKVANLRKPSPPPTEEEIKRHQRENLVRRSTSATLITALLGTIILIISIVTIIAPYVAKIGGSVKDWADTNVKQQIRETSNQQNDQLVPNPDSENQETDEIDKKVYFKSLFSVGLKRLESLKPKVEKLPGFSWTKNKVASYLKDEKNQEAMMAMVLSKTGGVFSFTANFVGNFLSLLLDLLLTVFFFSFFLQKMALYSGDQQQKQYSGGQYLVRGIFNSNWMPHTSSETREEAREILDNILLKLKTWVRGYLAIIFIETIAYITAFLILGVPYAPVLGTIAGFTVLLPYIGPFASGATTILVCFAIGNMSMVNILAVVGVYIVMNGIIEQLFLYPSLVGEALGLNALETIIVVLLGGLFAGVTGMIFAVPTASVLKYLIPKIYSCWEVKAEFDG